jgi:S1-C subfamily serine protease
VTLGIVSTKSRSGAAMGAIGDFIQTDAAINPGNSGGALINARGELIGINTMIYSETGGYQGIGFAIPSNTARRIMDELIQNGAVAWGSIGAIQWIEVDAQRARRAGLGAVNGLYVYDLDSGSSAYHAGLRPEDIVVAVNDQPTTALDQLERVVVKAPVGSSVKLDIVRNEKRQTLNVPIVSRQTAQRRR